MFNVQIPQQEYCISTPEERFHDIFCRDSNPLTFDSSSCLGITSLTEICISPINHFATLEVFWRTLELSLKQLVWLLASSPRPCSSNRVGVQLLHLHPCTTRTTLRFFSETFFDFPWWRTLINNWRKEQACVPERSS